MTPLDLPGVTLACVDTVNHALALRALERSRTDVRFARSVLLTDALPPGLAAPEGVEVETIGRLASRDDYSRFVLKSLRAHVATAHVLLIQWDGYVVNAQAFDPAFLACDYIGAKWYWHDDAMRVGNGGFSLRSRKLLDALQDPHVELVDAEDVTIGRAFRPLLERDYGIRFASEEIADRFAFEQRSAGAPDRDVFGFVKLDARVLQRLEQLPRAQREPAVAHPHRVVEPVPLGADVIAVEERRVEGARVDDVAVPLNQQHVRRVDVRQ